MISINLNEIAGWGSAILGMRNPMNSWDKCDSGLASLETFIRDGIDFKIGPNDLKLARKLALSGTDHAKYRRMIVVWVDIKAPRYFWAQFDAYKVGTVANSCSTMHKIGEKEFTKDDFSTEHLGVYYVDDYGDTVHQNLWEDKTLPTIIEGLNIARNFYIREVDPELKKKYWWQMIQLLPNSYNQTRMVMLNYEVLANIYKSRRNHKLDEWREFCKWIEGLPYAADIIFPWKDEKDT